MDTAHLDNETKIIFLAIFWGGGGPYSISQIIHVYDWINRGIPTRDELEYALNYLVENKLIILQDDKYLIPEGVGIQFDVFRKKRKIGKFNAVKKFFEMINPQPIDKMEIQISEKEYAEELEKYKDFMSS